MADFLNTPQDDDYTLARTAGSTLIKKLKWSSIKSTLKTYFDTIYSLTGHNHSGTYQPVGNYEPANSNIQTHISDNYIHVTTEDKSNWDSKQSELTFSTNIETDKNSTTKISAVKTFYEWVKSLLTASQISFTASGSITSSTVQTAIEELNSEKANQINYPLTPTSDYYTLTGSVAGDYYIQLAITRAISAEGLIFPTTDNYYQLLFNIRDGLNTATTLSKVTITNNSLIVLNSFLLENIRTLTEIDANNVAYSTASISCNYIKNLSILGFNSLKYNNGSINITKCPNITNISFPELLIISNSGALSIDGSYYGTINVSTTTTVSFPKLKDITNSLSIINLQNVSTFNFNELKSVYGTFTITNVGNNQAGMTSLLFPKLENVTSSINITSCPNITNVQLGDIVGNSLYFVNGNITINTGANLTLASLQNILRNIAYMDGTNANTERYTGRVITLKVAVGDRITSGADYTKIVTTMGNTITYV